MKQSVIYVLTSLFFLPFTSCQKDYPPTTINTVDSIPINTNDSTLLKLFVKLDTLHPAPFDTLYKMEFEYDNLKRVISYSYSDYDSTTGILLTTQDLKMQYHNNDTLPYTGILKDLYYDPYEEDVFVLNCSFNNGKLSYIGNYNSKNPQDSIVQKILYRGDSDITYTYQYPLGSFYDTSYHKALTVNGNILQDVTTYSYYTLTGLQGIYTYDNLFDDHANPFNRISFVFQLLSFYTLPYDPGEDGSFTKIMALSKNNIVESKFNRIVYQFSDDNYYSKNYIYNSNGLPVYASYTKQLAQQGQFYAGKELYFYTK